MTQRRHRCFDRSKDCGALAFHHVTRLASAENDQAAILRFFARTRLEKNANRGALCSVPPRRSDFPRRWEGSARLPVNDGDACWSPEPNGATLTSLTPQDAGTASGVASPRVKRKHIRNPAYPPSASWKLRTATGSHAMSDVQQLLSPALPFPIPSTSASRRRGRPSSGLPRCSSHKVTLPRCRPPHEMVSEPAGLARPCHHRRAAAAKAQDHMHLNSFDSAGVQTPTRAMDAAVAPPTRKGPTPRGGGSIANATSSLPPRTS
ncbi:hypothetical protein DFH07DRAFT_778529 [Mycena maculata]|uniref:Uncharacterized protein n=1 Tax=Mycena maculata TaxID=230809 RepID=A0AAD7ICE5_9AGAR|nr:hypothetical protein DFH07DRAFT_778529 [Mycena maculata]